MGRESLEAMGYDCELETYRVLKKCWDEVYLVVDSKTTTMIMKLQEGRMSDMTDVEGVKIALEEEIGDGE